MHDPAEVLIKNDKTVIKKMVALISQEVAMLVMIHKKVPIENDCAEYNEKRVS